MLLDPNDAPLTAIMHPVDELKLWVDLSVSQGCPMQLRRRAQALGAIFGPLVPKFQVLKADQAGEPLFMKSSGPVAKGQHDMITTRCTCTGWVQLSPPAQTKVFSGAKVAHLGMLRGSGSQTKHALLTGSVCQDAGWPVVGKELSAEPKSGMSACRLAGRWCSYSAGLGGK